ncbi:glycoside hydrolase [Podospora didyma]|uniref:Glycoside hydrolase n=1 Tax=Podospora didyma TaxID=330526 RepID=A0AAE0U022_9PEZI|nr:glycoside hydrolase [Podospora didyma]
MPFISRFFWTAICLALMMGRANAAVKGVFAHYMVGAMPNLSQVLLDVTQAQQTGIDAFALNVQHPDAQWTLDSLALLFAAASQVADFKLFFSMDMSVIPHPSAFVPLFQRYASHPVYYRYAGRPFLSTFRGGATWYGSMRPNTAWQAQMKTLLGLAAGSSGNMKEEPFFVPDFEDWAGKGTNSPYTADFFAQYPVVDGVMAWETAWPAPGSVNNVSSEHDAISLNAARAAGGKVFMMPVSTFQSKHLDNGGNNWYRRGGLTLPFRMAQVLELQPDFVQLLSWNDAGEGHYFGNIWAEGITGEMREMVDGYDHSAWRGLFAVFVAALKKGVVDVREMVPASRSGSGYMDFAGAFWYRPLLKDAGCSVDKFRLGKPDNWETAEDGVYAAVILPPEVKTGSGVSIKVWSGGSVVAKFPGTPGLNIHQVADIRKGRQVVQLVLDTDGSILGEGEGLVDVTDSITGTEGICNFNYQVVEIV